MMEFPDEDRETPNRAAKETLGQLRKSFRDSFRRVGEKSPFSSSSKGSKVTERTAASSDSGLMHQHAPPSPSLSGSPLRSIGGLFQKKEEEEEEGGGHASPPPAAKKPASLSRMQSDSVMALGDSLLKRGASIRRSLGLGGKKDRAKSCRQEVPVYEGVTEKKKEEEDEKEEVEESYTLPEIPDTPLSVMQISKLIEMEVLEEAHLNLLSLRQEFQRERAQHGEEEDSPVELAKKEKDLNLLYGDLRDKLKAIVRDSNSLPSRNKGLLVHVARIIQEEDRRAGEPSGIHGGWMEAWSAAVDEGVRAKLSSVHLDRREHNVSWLSVHLGLLGKAIVEDLEGVKKELRGSYPPSFNVFGTYVRSYHGGVGQHVEKLQQQVTELKDFYALINWIINHYQSERIMGNPSLRPEMCESDVVGPRLEDGFLDQLKEKYCCRMKEDMRSSLDKLIELENEDIWRDRQHPEKDEDFPSSNFPMDIWTTVKSNVSNSRLIDAELEMKVVSSCLEELKHFPKRFEAAFRRFCGAEDLPPALWTEYQITYINSFAALQQHMEGYRDVCPEKVEDFSREVKWLIVRLIQGLEDEFKEQVKPYLRRMMTRKWLTNNSDFQQLYCRTEQLSQHCALIRPPYAQELASRLHYHVVREYVSQLMKNNYSCKNRKHEKAAGKIREQWEELRRLFEDMESTHEWLHAVGDDLSDIIGQKNKKDIKEHVRPLVERYPDISRKHLAAILYFRGVTRGREQQLILQRLSELKKSVGSDCDKSRILFGNMQVTVNTDCLSSLPSSCLSFLLPDD